MAGRHERPPHLRQLAPIAAAVLLAALALVISPVGGDRWLRGLAAVAVLVVALPGMAALDGLLRVSDRAAEQATARAEEAARLRLQVAELRRDHESARESTAGALEQLQRDVTATRAFARGGRDELVTAIERIGTLERGLTALRGEVGEVSTRLARGWTEQAGAARAELATMRAEVAGTRSQVVATSQEVTASRTDAAQVALAAQALHDQLATLRTELAALRAELDVHADGVEATTVRMTLPLVRAALRRDPLEPVPAGARRAGPPRRRLSPGRPGHHGRHGSLDGMDTVFGLPERDYRAVSPRLASMRRVTVLSSWSWSSPRSRRRRPASPGAAGSRPSYCFSPLAALGWGWVALGRTARSWRYAERAEDLLIVHGVLFRRLVVVPYGRMQLVDVHVDPISRAFGLARVQLHTAAATTDAHIPGLEPAEATRLRDRLSALGEARSAGL